MKNRASNSGTVLRSCRTQAGDGTHEGRGEKTGPLPSKPRGADQHGSPVNHTGQTDPEPSSSEGKCFTARWYMSSKTAARVQMARDSELDLPHNHC